MNFKIISVLALLLIIPIATSSSNPYGEYYTYEVYYNGDKLGLDAAKPLIKIGEPFTISIEMTMNQECQTYVELSDIGTNIGENHFELVDGPSQLGEGISKIFKKNETHTFEWTLKATEEWAGGSAPIDFYYSAITRESPEPFVSSSFTAVYPTISTEYYEQPEPTKTTQSTPAFTIPLTLTALLLAYKRKR